MDVKPQPPHNFDVTEASGYEFEERQTARLFNGWGGQQTRLPKGHLARRDTHPVMKTGSDRYGS